MGAVTPSLAFAIPTEDDAELFKIIRQREAGTALESSFGAEHTAMERLAKANEPPEPPELLQPIELPAGKESPRHAQGWTVQELGALLHSRLYPISLAQKWR